MFFYFCVLLSLCHPHALSCPSVPSPSLKRSSSKSFRPVDCCALAAAVDVAEAEAVAVVKALALAVTVVLDVGSIGSYGPVVRGRRA